MINNYEIAEIVEIGKAQDVILGDYKAWQMVDDSPQEGLRHIILEDDE